jgi:hypothetical protein
MASQVERYFRPIYEDVREIKLLSSITNSEIDSLYAFITQVLNNTYIMLSDEVGISQYELSYNIVPYPTDTLEFRRQRLITRKSLRPPFTLLWLRSQLDTLLGEGTYSLEIDYPNRAIRVRYSGVEKALLKELILLLTRAKPANMTLSVTGDEYIDQIVSGVSEIIYASGDAWNYKLDGTWYLGQKAFRSILTSEVVKLATTPSFTPEGLNLLASYLASQISIARLNSSQSIPVSPTVSENVVVVEYQVTTDLVTQIDLIELLSTSTSITSAEVDIELTAGLTIRHELTVHENASISTNTIISGVI